MKWIFTAACLAAMALASASGADAKGCIKGAIVGGVAGHMAGHGKLGAAAGCVIGHHEANKKNPERFECSGADGPEVTFRSCGRIVVTLPCAEADPNVGTMMIEAETQLVGPS
ncbi:uncharacterized protein YcfJ [Bradyrhizobium barranii subsp. barranii]